jgi:RHH-type proline utilization regulon transcriptional repressor/proline dehydrogenase/delta 1-pyrroline-5-carboxylate dehydrogenase
MLTPGFDTRFADAAVALAAALLHRASELQTPSEKRQQAELDRMVRTASDKATIVQLTDEAFRSRRPARTAEHLVHLLDVQGIPRFFSPLDQALLTGFRTFGGWLPSVSVPLVKEQMRHETANVVLPAEPEHLARHLRERRSEGLRMNVNFLGDSLLGEMVAAHRLDKYLAALQLPEVEVISVKISTLFSQIAPHAREQTLRTLCDRLEPLYREALHLRYTRLDGTRVPKFVYLDMEEYRDLELTAAAFMRTLDRSGLENATAGIALQAYIPDSQRIQREITAWALRRVAAGGAPVAVRLVKGANMEAERVEASLRGWPQAPYRTKLETDAAYKRMLAWAFDPAHLRAVRVGIASHNLFDIACGLLLTESVVRQEPALIEQIQFEMLEGMANHQRRALCERVDNLLLYAPACRKDEFLNAVGYLLRRLDENTGPENFLRHTFRLTVGSDDWQQLERGFREACVLPVDDAPRRTQNRNNETLAPALPEQNWRAFVNEPDTDFSLPENSRWAEQLTRRIDQPSSVWPDIPLIIGGDEVTSDRRRRPCLDPSRPGVVLCHSVEATEQDVDRAVTIARQDPAGWRTRTHAERSSVLGVVAAHLRASRGRLLRTALANAGKTVIEGDPEVSEAIDFVEFYRASAGDWIYRKDLVALPRGVVVVVPPWNFPIAIPCGGIAAALAAGNTVIIKPASASVLVAWELCRCFWEAGVPREALQFLPCPGSGAGAALVAHPEVDVVLLTGGTETALRMLAARPALRLSAETGGKNAYVITALSDHELAIKHVVQSAFGHAGQKCSAVSLLLLEAEVYDDPRFREQLVDAVRSLPVGSAWDLTTRIGPLIQPSAGELDAALKTLEPGESWLVRPEPRDNNPQLWSPGVKWGVTPGSVTHLTEFFGPVLGVLRFESLDEAIELVNATGYGLTSGLASLDEREHAQWMERVRAGNLYINRGTTGAIVLRQPFGGWGNSGIGPGFKAGGPNYLVPLLAIDDRPPESDASPPVSSPAPAITDADLRHLVEELERADADAPFGDPLIRRRLRTAVASLEQAWLVEYSQSHDHFRLVGQDNLRRYRPYREIRVRVTPDDTALDLYLRVAAARVIGAWVTISAPLEFDSPALRLLDRLTEHWGGQIEFLEECDDQLAEWIESLGPHSDERLRYAAPDRVPPGIRRAAALTGIYIADEPVREAGSVELLWLLREQSLSFDYHRYGNLGARSEEPRAAVL